MKFVSKCLLQLFFILWFTNCIKKDGYTTSIFILNNVSSVNIEILPTNFMVDTLSIASQSNVIDKSTPIGKGKSEGVLFAYFLDFENPIVVIFDKKDTIKHYNDTLSHLGNYYNLKSERCFYNSKSYTKKIEPIGKESNDVTLTYTITEQDYLDAKK